MPVSSGLRREDHAGDVAVGDQADAGAGLADRRDELGVARPVEDQGGDLVRLDALRLGEAVDVLLRRSRRDRRRPSDSRGRWRSCACRRRARRAACRPRPSPSRRSSPACPWRRASCLRADRPRYRPSGRCRLPTFSPMNSIGASSRSPSPITTVPSIGSLLSSRRMASTAAWSAAFSSPRPRRRAEATAARSVTRTSSRVRMRSMIWPGWTVMPCDMDVSSPC